MLRTLPTWSGEIAIMAHCVNKEVVPVDVRELRLGPGVPPVGEAGGR